MPETEVMHLVQRIRFPCCRPDMLSCWILETTPPLPKPDIKVRESFQLKKKKSLWIIFHHLLSLLLSMTSNKMVVNHTLPPFIQRRMWYTTKPALTRGLTLISKGSSLWNMPCFETFFFNRKIKLYISFSTIWYHRLKIFSASQDQHKPLWSVLL